MRKLHFVIAAVVLVAAIAIAQRGRQTTIFLDNRIYKGTMTQEAAAVFDSTVYIDAGLTLAANAGFTNTAVFDKAVYIDGGLTFRNATAPATIFTDVNATTATSTVPTFQVVPTATLGANDLIFAVKAVAGGSNVFTVDLEGDVTGSAISGTTGTFSGRIHSTSTTTVGQITLETGTGTATVFSGAICVCSEATDETKTVKCAVSSTTLTATGTGSDVINYICL